VRRAVVLLVSLATAVCLAGCGNGEPQNPLTIAIEDQLRPNEPSKQATLDFDSLVEGDWTRLVLVCGATDEVVADALGFPWEQPREAGVRSGFAYVFATNDRVEQFFGPRTAAPFDDRSYVSSCEWGDGDSAHLILFERQDAVIQYQLHETPAYALPEAWFPISGQGTPFYGSRWD
jgi:hypothetical protein